MVRRVPDRLVIFGDPGIEFARTLLDSFLGELRHRDDIEVVAICDTGRSGRSGEFLRICRRLAIRAFNPELRNGPRAPGFHRTAGRYGTPVIVPPARDVNSPEFLDELRDRWRPTLALSVGCLQIFSPDLLDVFELAVNFHDGYLPGYGGLGATAWSLYNRESRTGYTYHVMNPGIDTGPTLVRGTIEVPHGAPARSIRHDKTVRAARDAGEVLDRMASRAEGTPQAVAGVYYSRLDGKRIRTIENPGALLAEELLLRLRCFELLTLGLHGEMVEVTGLREGTGRSRNSLTTADGKSYTLHRCLFLPVWLYRVYRKLRT
jgi:folate-dependent phosphoribosylglycinamide formyltransferase PurN